MNGIPVYPLPKNGERPYLATPATPFLGVIFWVFLAFFSPLPSNLISCTITLPTQLIFIFIFIIQLHPH